MRHSLRNLMLGLAAVVVVAGGMLAVPADAAGGAFCGHVWGSGPKQASGSATSMRAVRAGEQSCYDRLVIDVNGPAAGWNVRYVSAMLTEGQGVPVALRGGARLDVTVNAATNDANGRPSYTPSNPAEVVDVTGFRTFREVAFGGSFEGHTTFGLGVRAQLPFRVFVLAGPGSSSRVVIDVGHQW